jgi:hypothetical protein
VLATTSFGITGTVVILTRFIAEQSLPSSQVAVHVLKAAASGDTGQIALLDASSNILAITNPEVGLFSTANSQVVRNWAAIGGHPSTYNLVAGTTYQIAIYTNGSDSWSLAAAPNNTGALWTGSTVSGYNTNGTIQTIQTSGLWSATFWALGSVAAYARFT